MKVCTYNINVREHFANSVKNAISLSLDTRIKYPIYGIYNIDGQFTHSSDL